MTLLTFNTLQDELISGKKKQTIRLNVKYWSSRLDSNTKLDIWWLNPRNKHPNCHKMGIGAGSYITKRGWCLSRKDAMKDGFKNLKELREKLMKLNDLTLSEVLESKWIIISWK